MGNDVYGAMKEGKSGWNHLNVSMGEIVGDGVKRTRIIS